MRCSWIQRGSFPRLSARAKRLWRKGDGDRLWAREPSCPCPRAAGLGKVAQGSGSYLVGKDHEAVVCLAPDGSAHTLGRMAHGVEGEEVVLSDLELVPQVLQSRLRVGARTGGKLSCPPMPPLLPVVAVSGPTRTLRMRLWV